MQNIRAMLIQKQYPHLSLQAIAEANVQMRRVIKRRLPQTGRVALRVLHDDLVVIEGETREELPKTVSREFAAMLRKNTKIKRVDTGMGFKCFVGSAYLRWALGAWLQ